VKLYKEKFFKKIGLLVLALSLCSPFAMCMSHKQEVACNSFTSNNSDALSQKTLSVAQTFFTPELLAKAQSDGLISKETHEFMEQLPLYLKELLHKGDTIFASTNGYKKLKEKVYNAIKNFSEIITPSAESAKQTPTQETISCLNSLKEELKKLSLNNPKLIHKTPESFLQELSKKLNGSNVTEIDKLALIAKLKRARISQSKK
jgi:hypothetical protein